jgi:hypothetical protein
LKPKKADGPGPGDYIMPSTIKQMTRSATSKQECTFGGGKRGFTDLPQGNPSPTQYQPPVTGTPYDFLPYNERKGFLFGNSERTDMAKDGHTVGPGTYSPDHNAVMKVATSKKMLGRNN